MILLSCDADLTSNAVESEPVSSGSDRRAADTEVLSPYSISEFPVDAEWRAVFNESLGDFNRVQLSAASEYRHRLEKCMRTKGFDFSAGHAQAPEIDVRVVSNPLRTDTLEMGYHLPPAAEVVGQTALTPEIELALFGVESAPGVPAISEASSVGELPCVQTNRVVSLLQAQQDVDEVWIALVRTLEDQTGQYDELEEAARGRVAWSRCMEQNGIEVASREELRQRFSLAETVTDQEREARLFDYNCDVEVGMTEDRSTWQRRRYDEWRSLQAESIEDLMSFVGLLADEVESNGS